MTGETAPVALVIPLLNEAATLPILLRALSALNLKPAELIFVDAGSRDASVRMINDWWQSAAWQGARLAIVDAPNAYPGAARNAGIEQSSQPWIAFLDAGVTPDSDWLHALVRASQSGQPAGIFGVIRFTGQNALTTALCALSYGQDATRPTLPASMFRRDAFTAVGKFDPALRAGEDLLWLARFHQVYPQRVVENAATAVYFHFPPSLAAAARKWFGYERHTARAGLNNRAAIASLVVLVFVLSAFALSPPAGLAFCLLYLLLRGVVDPVRRSRRWNWWRAYPAGFLLAPLCAVVIDAAKFMGRITGTWERARV